MGWARRLKRVFAIDIETCERCGVHTAIDFGNEVHPKAWPLALVP